MRKLFLTLTLVLSAFLLNAEVVEKTYNFNDPKIVEIDGYQLITFEKALLTGQISEPVLPYCSVVLLLPPGESAGSIEIIRENEVQLEGDYLIYPKQYVRPLSEKSSGVFVKNEAVYLSGSDYPADPSGNLSTEFMNGYSLALSAFTPVKYNPATGKLSYYKNVTVRIKTQNDDAAVAALRNLNSSKNIIKRVSDFSHNPEVITDYPVRENRSDDYQLLIITPSEFSDDFLPLAELYGPRGIITEVVTTESIYSGMAGQDNQEKIRNYIIQEYEDHAITYVLLGGDVEHVPYRGFYCTVQSSMVYADDNIPSDLYYSALDGTWNDNGNNRWGEIGEDDLLPEIGVARFTFTTQDDLDNMLNKTISYQANPVLNELDKPLLAGEHLYDDPLSWGADYLDLLIGYQNENGYETTGIPEVHNYETLYDRDQTWTASTLLSKINEGKSFIHHCGHANSDYSMRFNIPDITNSNFSQVNGTTHNYTLVYSHGCISGAFDDNDCIAEAMLNIENFAVSVVMNSRYGWFNEGQTEGPSAHLHREFTDALYNQKENHIGMAHTLSRVETAPWVNAPGQWEEGALRWCFYDCNVLGGSALSIWTDEPIEIEANYIDNLVIGGISILISITNNGSPVEGLNCVFYKDEVNYGMAETDATGTAEIVFNSNIPSLGDAVIYVSGYNCQLTGFPVTIIPTTGAYVVYSSYEINDETGNDNGIAEYAEFIELSMEMANAGFAQADNVNVIISSADEYVTILDDTEFYGDIAGGGGVVNIEDAFSFEIAENIPDQHKIDFIVEATGQETWMSPFSVIVGAPNFEVDGFTFDDSSGNNNGLLDPGETAEMIITVNNAGASDAYNVAAQLTSSDPMLTVITAQPQNIGNLIPSTTGQATFTVYADPDIVPGYIGELNIQFTADVSISQEEAIQFPLTYCVASTNGPHIHIANVLCGDINKTSGWQGAVADYTDISTTLEPGIGEPITITNGFLWFDDKVTVWVDWDLDREFGNNDNETFGLTNTGGQGLTYTGEITPPANQPGGQFRMRIRMTHSSNPGPCGSSFRGEIEDYTLFVSSLVSVSENLLQGAGAIQNYPNPFSDFTTLTYSLEKETQVKIVIRDLSGRMVTSLLDEKQLAGEHTVRWDATNFSGKHVQSGIYFCTIKMGDKTTTIKLVVQR